MLKNDYIYINKHVCYTFFTIGALLLHLSLAISGSADAQRVTVTFAGTGTAGFNGQGMPGYLTEINIPMDVCMNAAHDMYFVDAGNDLIRKISALTGLSLRYANIMYTVSSGSCTNFSYYQLEVGDSTTMVNNVTAGISNITIAPNPATAYFTIKTSSPFDDQVTITITNITGQKIKEITGSSNQQIGIEIDAPAGIYLLHACTVHGNMSSKFVIK